MEQIKLYELINVRRVLGEITQNKALSFKAMYRIAMFLKDTDAQEKFWADNIRKIFDEFGAVDGVVPAEHAEEANAKIDELAKMDIDIDPLLLTEEQLQDIDSITLSQVLAILPFISKN